MSQALQKTPVKAPEKPVEGSKEGMQGNVPVPKKKGRPSRYNEETVERLERGLRAGKPVILAVKGAGLNMTTYSRWLQDNPDFRNRVEAAKEEVNWVSRRVIKNAIRKDKNVAVAQWWLERRDSDFKEATQAGVAVQVNVTDGITKKPSVDVEQS